MIFMKDLNVLNVLKVVYYLIMKIFVYQVKILKIVKNI